MKNRTVWITKSLLVMGIMMLLLTACFSGDAQQTVESQKLALPIGQYGYITWLHPDSLIVKYMPLASPGTYPWFNIYEASLSGKKLESLPKPEFDDCMSFSPSWTSRRLDGVLIAISECDRWFESYNGGYSIRYDFMYAWDQVLKAWHEIHAYPAYFSSVEFSFSPDKHQLVQTQAKGFQSEIYRVTPGQGQMRILPLPEPQTMSRYSDALDRVRSPNWSPLDDRIVFAGSGDAPGPNSWQGIFSARSDGSDVKELVRGVMHLSPIKLSPDGHYIAFAGQYGIAPYSVWLYAVQTGQLTRIWSKGSDISALDWSPDGRRLAIVTVDQTMQGIPWELNSISLLNLDSWLKTQDR